MKIREIRFDHNVKVPGTSDLKNGICALFDGKPTWNIQWEPGDHVVTITAVPGTPYHTRDPWSALIPIGNVTCILPEYETPITSLEVVPVQPAPKLAVVKVKPAPKAKP